MESRLVDGELVELLYCILYLSERQWIHTQYCGSRCHKVFIHTIQQGKQGTSQSGSGTKSNNTHLPAPLELRDERVLYCLFNPHEKPKCRSDNWAFYSGGCVPDYFLAGIISTQSVFASLVGCWRNNKLEPRSSEPNFSFWWHFRSFLICAVTFSSRGTHCRCFCHLLLWTQFHTACRLHSTFFPVQAQRFCHDGHIFIVSKKFLLSKDFYFYSTKGLCLSHITFIYINVLPCPVSCPHPPSGTYGISTVIHPVYLWLLTLGAIWGLWAHFQFANLSRWCVG